MITRLGTPDVSAATTRSLAGRVACALLAVSLLLCVEAIGVQAAESPKEGTLELSSCWSGVSNVVSFSKSLSASSYELTGTTRSNPPGGVFDMVSFRCVGSGSSIDGKVSGTSLCENVDKDGDKFLSRNIFDGPKSMNETLGGTGKFEGMVRNLTTESVGQFPTAKPGTFQGCNRAIGTYKLK